MEIETDPRAEVSIKHTYDEVTIEIEDVKGTLHEDIIKSILETEGVKPFLEMFDYSELKEMELYLKEIEE